MKNIYSFRKSLAALVQKYRVRKHFVTIRKLFMFLFFVWLIGSMFTILAQYIFAREFHHSVGDYLRYFWVVIIELVSGFDIPDTIPLHLISQIISVIMLIMGIVVVGLFTGQIISMVIYVLNRNEFVSEKPDHFQFRKPILICGVSSKLENIVRQLRKNEMSRQKEIVIIDEHSDEIRKVDEEYFEDVWYVKGEPLTREILEKAIGKIETRVIILERKQNNPYFSSQCTINTALAVESIDKDIHTVVEVTHLRDAEHFQRTSINDMINISDFGMKLISQAALKHGMAKVFSLLLGENAGCQENVQIYFSPLPLEKAFVGKSYHEIAQMICQEFSCLNITLLGFARYISDEEKEKLGLRLRNTNYFIQINPRSRPVGHDNTEEYLFDQGKIFFLKDTRLTERDQLIYLAERPIHFKNALKQIEGR